MSITTYKMVFKDFLEFACSLNLEECIEDGVDLANDDTLKMELIDSIRTGLVIESEFPADMTALDYAMGNLADWTIEHLGVTE